MFDHLALIIYPSATTEQADRIVGLGYLGVFIAATAAIVSVPLSFLL